VPTPIRRNHVFINCPFDKAYKPIFDAIVFAIRDLGFVARSALDIDDGAEVRLAKIERIVEECRYGIHDISNVALDANTGLPRFNMPLELGLFSDANGLETSANVRRCASFSIANLIVTGNAFRTSPGRTSIPTAARPRRQSHGLETGWPRRLSASFCLEAPISLSDTIDF